MVGWAGLLGQRRQVRSPGKVFFPYFVFLFYFSDICSDLVIILNQFIYLCHFLWKLVILIQSYLINGIIFGHILIYKTNIFPKQIIIGLIQMAKINIHELLKYLLEFYL